jgi:hypothetical protein
MFPALDFVYMPSTDVAADLAHFTDVAGGRLVFAIEKFGTRVAMVEFSVEGPALLLAGHLRGDAAILVYRVENLAEASAELAGRGWEPEVRSGIPHGPLHSYRAPGGQRFALYELTRPEAAAQLAGRRDF